MKPFITGASGFIGGRIAERLWLERGVKATCLVQSLTNASRLARLPVTIVPGDVLNKNALEKAMAGCDVVFHCAFGNTADPVLNRRINEEGLQNLGEISLKIHIRRFIHISTIAVYGSQPPAYVDEETPVAFSGNEYGDSKIRAESIARALIKGGLPLVIIRPTIVFGPFSPIWTIGAVKRVLSGGWENTEAIHGLCNPVYIDDLVTALFLCIEKDTAIGETFIISGSEPIPWNDFFGYYKKMLGSSQEKSLSTLALDKISVFQSAAHTLIQFLRRFLEPQLIHAYEMLKMKYPSLARTLYRFVSGGIQKNEIQQFSQETVYSIQKAKRMLGYLPRFFNEGMEQTERWLRHHEFVPSSPGDDIREGHETDVT
jgi:nucleoside-diphosphate-sugar epimerase